MLLKGRCLQRSLLQADLVKGDAVQQVKVVKFLASQEILFKFWRPVDAS